MGTFIGGNKRTPRQKCLTEANGDIFFPEGCEELRAVL